MDKQTHIPWFTLTVSLFPETSPSTVFSGRVFRKHISFFLRVRNLAKHNCQKCDCHLKITVFQFMFLENDKIGYSLEAFNQKLSTLMRRTSLQKSTRFSILLEFSYSVIAKTCWYDWHILTLEWIFLLQHYLFHAFSKTSIKHFCFKKTYINQYYFQRPNVESQKNHKICCNCRFWFSSINFSKTTSVTFCISGSANSLCFGEGYSEQNVIFFFQWKQDTWKKTESCFFWHKSKFKMKFHVPHNLFHLTPKKITQPFLQAENVQNDYHFLGSECWQAKTVNNANNF